MPNPIVIDMDIWRLQTAELDATLYGAYFEACVWFATNGNLPSDLESCAEVMRLCGADRIAIAREVLANLFLPCLDGTWEPIRQPLTVQSQKNRLATAFGEVDRG